MQDVSGAVRSNIFSETTSILVDREHTKTSRVGEENATLGSGCRHGDGWDEGRINQIQSHDPILPSSFPDRRGVGRKKFYTGEVPTVA